MADLKKILRKLGDGAEMVANKAVKTAGDLAQKSNYKLEINKYRREIKRLTEELGKSLIQSKYAGHGDEELLDLIDTAYRRIEAFQWEIEKVKILLSEVGMEADLDYDFTGEEFEEVFEEAKDKAEDFVEEVVPCCCEAEADDFVEKKEEL